jgi:hypothetical protein
MKLTKSKLKQIIKEELGRVLEKEEYKPLYEVLGMALQDFVKETDLKLDPKVAEALKDYDWTTEDQDWKGTTALVLGTIEQAGGDYLYDVMKDAGLLDALLQKMHEYAEKFAKPVKRKRKLAIIPYSDHMWNEDKWGEEL